MVLCLVIKQPVESGTTSHYANMPIQYTVIFKKIQFLNEIFFDNFLIFAQNVKGGVNYTGVLS